MTEVTIEISDLNQNTKKVAVNGQLDESNVDEKIKQIYSVIQNAKGLNILFDFENLQYMNSKSIGYLTDLYGKITENGGKVVISKAKPNIEDILQVVGLNQLIPMVGTDQEAMLKLGSAAAAAATPQPTTPQPTAPAESQPVKQEVPTPPPAPSTPQAQPTTAPTAAPAQPAQTIDLSSVETPVQPAATPAQMPEDQLNTQQ